ncbi:MAG: S4 domain-containing protein, partial [Ktedonobacterales bacterium]
TRPMARQIVNHGHVRVGGRRVDIPSYLVRPGEVIELDETTAQMPEVAEEMAARPTPDWLAREGTSGRVLRLPDRADADARLDADQIIAFYAR